MRNGCHLDEVAKTTSCIDNAETALYSHVGTSNVGYLGFPVVL